MKRYQPVRLSYEDYIKLKQKQERMNKDFEKLTGKKRVIPLTRVLSKVISDPVYMWNDELVRLFKEGKIRRIKKI